MTAAFIKRALVFGLSFGLWSLIIQFRKQTCISVLVQFISDLSFTHAASAAVCNSRRLLEWFFISLLMGRVELNSGQTEPVLAFPIRVNLWPNPSFTICGPPDTICA